MAKVRLVSRPQRWDQPFGDTPLSKNIIAQLRQTSILSLIHQDGFPDDLSPDDILAHDTRLLRKEKGEIVYRGGEYDNSIYLVLNGSVHNQLARGKTAPEKAKYQTKKSWLRVRQVSDQSHQPPDEGNHRSERYGVQAVFGLAEAMSRSRRTFTAIASETDTIILEISWPGLRDLRNWSKPFRNLLERHYRMESLMNGLRSWDALAHLDRETLIAIAEACRFETYGDFGWTHAFQRHRQSSATAIANEDLIVEEGHYLDDVILIQAGFARVSRTFGHGERSVGYLGAGETFGGAEIAASRTIADPPQAPFNLRAMGHTALIRIPAPVAEPYLEEQSETEAAASAQTTLDFFLDSRLVNGTRAMAIDTTRCVDCDDCLRACAATHDGVARFVRNGPRQGAMMIANACMHCTDPVCMIDCPTGAIHREPDSGSVVIDNQRCIGCATCAASCPYGNIRMEPVRDADGSRHIDADGSEVLRATKCDLCVGQPGGPACKRACPHNALMRVDLSDTVRSADWINQV